MANRPAPCGSCGKRLSLKGWYYRNGNYYCTKRCWQTAAAKSANEAAEKKAEAATANAAADKKKAQEAAPVAEAAKAPARPS